MIRKKKLIVIVAVVLNVLFATSYFLLSRSVVVGKSQTFYVVQVGAYGSKDNANEMMDKLKAIQIETYSYTKEGLIYVLTCLSTKMDEIDKNMELLTANQVNHVKREYVYTLNNTLTIETMLEFLGQSS